jgi:hypothetical protein
MRAAVPSGMSMAQAYGLGTGVPTTNASELHAMGRPGVEDVTTSQWWHPQSPLFWVGTLLAATVGLAAISGSGSVKAGPIHASASAGLGK